MGGPVTLIRDEQRCRMSATRLIREKPFMICWCSAWIAMLSRNVLVYEARVCWPRPGNRSYGDRARAHCREILRKGEFAWVVFAELAHSVRPT